MTITLLDINMKSNISLQKCAGVVMPLKAVKININKISWENTELKRLKKEEFII